MSETSETPLLQHTPALDPARAALAVDLGTRSPYRVSPFLMGKFCEHLGSNIYHGMEAQILVNPTFGKWVFTAGDDGVDGGMKPEYDREKMARRAEWFIRHQGFPETNTLFEDFLSGGAFGWMRVGDKEKVILSPDSRPHGGRAQRVEVLTGGKPRGLVQWTYLPLHRTRRYEYRLTARAATAAALTLSLSALGPDGTPGAVLASAALPLDGDWATHTGTLELPADAALDPAGLYAIALTVSEPANVVISRLLLYPGDHIGHADPDVIKFLREARLPLLRWPGGNFASGYDWRDGIGPVEQRPTKPNPAWGSLEYNLFGTAEFIAFCRAVGCEPMICVNAGDGTADDAAAWVEYCNGSEQTPMGRLRAAHGHPEPFGVRYWEVGNEVYGRWQIHWTTAGGYSDRYKQFARAMQSADPDIRLLACGFPWWPDDAWDRRLIAD
ncbi:MAG: alpha-N-arabinofuranosidase, partial [Armatimonadetes bacterium]|nr:alpha-N-arabinofuranosidase [Armatimonadota bacterium]